MVEHDEESRYPVLSRTDVAVRASNSRLLQRGLHEFQQLRMEPLRVIALRAARDSLFLLSDDWDAQTPIDYYRRVTADHDLKSVWERRTLLIYRFDLNGAFRGPVTLPLLIIGEEERARIRQRSAYLSSIRIQGEYISFCETFVVGSPLDGSSTPDWRWVDVNYLFSMDGERLVSWVDHVDALKVQERNHVVLDGFTLDSPLVSTLSNELVALDLPEEEVRASRMRWLKIQDLTSAAAHSGSDGVVLKQGSIVHSEDLANLSTDLPWDPSPYLRDLEWGGAISASDERSVWIGWESRRNHFLLRRVSFEGGRPLMAGIEVPTDAELLTGGHLQLPTECHDMEFDEDGTIRCLRDDGRTFGTITIFKDSRTADFWPSGDHVVWGYFVDIWDEVNEKSRHKSTQPILFAVEDASRLVPVRSWKLPFPARTAFNGSYFFYLDDAGAGLPKVVITDCAHQATWSFFPTVSGTSIE